MAAERGNALERLRDLVRLAAGLELEWDLHLGLLAAEVPDAKLDGQSALGWTSWLPTGTKRTKDAWDLCCSGPARRAGRRSCAREREGDAMAMISREVIAGKLGDVAMRALESGFELASVRRDGYVEPHHWLLQILHQPDSDLVRILGAFGIDPGRVDKDLTAALDRQRRGGSDRVDFSSHLDLMIERGWIAGQPRLRGDAHPHRAPALRDAGRGRAAARSCTTSRASSAGSRRRRWPRASPA